MNLGIKNKNVLITGASQNIGRSIALNMAREGCNIAICARNKEKLNDVVFKMKQYSGKYHSINLDLQKIATQTQKNCFKFDTSNKLKLFFTSIILSKKDPQPRVLGLHVLR